MSQPVGSHPAARRPAADPSHRRPFSGQGLALGILTLISPLCLVLCFWQGPWTDAAFAAVACSFPVALMLLGASRRGRFAVAGWAILGLGVLLLGVMAGLFRWRGQGVDGPWWGGLPPAAAIQLYGIFVLPLILTCTAYAWTFDRHFLDPEALRSLRRDFPEPKVPEAR